jgi:hypothetical protein
MTDLPDQGNAHIISPMRPHLVGLKATVGEVRLETFEGREHVVLPVVALVEGVIHASNSATPELVLAEEFGKVPQGWDGRPVMMNHPEMGGAKVSANSPAVLERWQIGTVFHSRVKDKRLLMEAYLDPARVEAVGTEAVALLEKARAGELVEVSVGVFVASEEAAGEFNGLRFVGIWRDIVPDHLALLPEGAVGACNVDMGCGTPRAASSKGGSMKRLKERFAELLARFTPAAAEETSDSDLRARLDAALFASEPGYLGIVEVYPESSVVVYATAPEGEVRYFRCSFSQAEDAVSLDGKPEEVRQVTKYEPVTASAAPCGSGVRSIEAPAGKEKDMDRKQRIAALVASGKQCFSAEQLEKMDDEALATLEAHVTAATTEPPPAPVAPEVETEPPAPPEVEQKPIGSTPEQEAQEAAAFLAKHPDIAAALEAHRAAAAASRKAVVDKLVAAQKAYTTAELEAMPLDALKKLASAVVREAVDFAPGAPRAAEKEAIPPPPSMRAAILEMRSKKSA